MPFIRALKSWYGLSDLKHVGLFMISWRILIIITVRVPLNPFRLSTNTMIFHCKIDNHCFSPALYDLIDSSEKHGSGLSTHVIMLPWLMSTYVIMLHWLLSTHVIMLHWLLSTRNNVVMLTQYSCNNVAMTATYSCNNVALTIEYSWYCIDCWVRHGMAHQQVDGFAADVFPWHDGLKFHS